jgi:hypothetical protein
MKAKHFKAELKKALELLREVGFLEAWEFKNELVVVTRRY